MVFSRNAQLQAIVITIYWHKEMCTLHDVMEITNGQPCIAKLLPEFLLQRYKKMIKSNFYFRVLWSGTSRMYVCLVDCVHFGLRAN